MLKEQATRKPASTLPASLERNRMLSAAQMAGALNISLQHFRRMYRTEQFTKPTLVGARKLGWPASVLIAITGETSPDRAA